MLKELLSHRPIQVALVFVILIGISSVFYLNHVKTETEGDVANPETSIGRQEIPSVSTSDTPDAFTQGGHFHADGTWHAEPHETPPEPSQPIQPPPNAKASGSRRTSSGAVAWLPESKFPDGVKPEWAYQALREMYSPADGNPPPFENVPVNLWDFQATKAAFEKNLAFYMANWNPTTESSHEVNIAWVQMGNIAEAAKPLLGIFTLKECEQIQALERQRSEFERRDPYRVYQLWKSESKTIEEASRIATYEWGQRWGLSDDELIKLYGYTPEEIKDVRRYSK